MRLGILVLVLLLGGCQSSAMKDTAGAAADETLGVWIGLDDSGAMWWRLELGSGGRGKAAIARGSAVATYRITAWTVDDNGKTSVHLVRSGSATAADKFPASVKLSGASDDSRMRLAEGNAEVVFWREDRLIRQRNRLRQRMEGSAATGSGQ